jgi:hypothetical protein
MMPQAVLLLATYPFIYYIQNLEISPKSFFFYLINSNAFNSSDYTVLNDKMISGLDRMRKEEVMAYSFNWRYEENHKNPVMISAFQLKFENKDS